MEKVFVASDIHDDVEALGGFTDYAQSQNVDRIWLLGDLSLKPYTSEHANELLQTEDIPKFIENKRKHNLVVLRDMKNVLDNSGIPYNVIPGNYDSDISDVFGEKEKIKK